MPQMTILKCGFWYNSKRQHLKGKCSNLLELKKKKRNYGLNKIHVLKACFDLPSGWMKLVQHGLPASIFPPAFLWRNEHVINFPLLKPHLVTDCNHSFSLKLTGHLAQLCWTKSYCLSPVFWLPVWKMLLLVFESWGESCVSTNITVRFLGFFFCISAGLMKNFTMLLSPSPHDEVSREYCWGKTFHMSATHLLP